MFRDLYFLHGVVLVLFFESGVSASKANDTWPEVVEKYCLECHDAGSKKGRLNLDEFLSTEITAHPEVWEKVVRQLRARQMPPPGKEHPDEAAYESTISALVEKLDALAGQNPKPGRTDTLRRLTRTEYRNAIRDLLGLDMDVSEMLPADESSHGFDNITVGDLSASLLERYMGAAQKISRLAVGIPTISPDGKTVRLRPDFTQEKHVPGLPLGTRGGAVFSHLFPRDGQYEVQIRLARDRNEKVEGLRGSHDLVILIDREEMASLKIVPPKKRNDHSTFDANLKARFEVEAGPRDLGVTFVAQNLPVEESLRQPYESHFNFHRHPRLSPAIFEVTILGPFEDTGVGETVSRKRIFSVRPSEKLNDEAAAKTNLARLMRLAFRRPVTEGDLNRVLPFFRMGTTESGTFDGGMEAALSAILVSRDFLFRIERDPDGIAPGKPYPISNLELASRLSFFLWSSLPDEELLELAEEKKLRDPSVLESQTRRMLADHRSEALISNFASQWLYLRNLESFTPDGRLFPDFDDNLRQAFRRETELLFSTLIREDRSVLDLLKSSGETFLNERLAKHYGIPHIYGSRFRRVTLDEGIPRGGLLRHGSILTATSYATRTSPVIRGNWILENFLGTPPPPPPPNVPTLEENSVSAKLPFRERLAAHREKAVCASCHDVMDPVGFSLENFDAVGRWRDREKGEPIDSRGRLPGGNDFSGVEGLEKALLERSDLFVRTLTEKLLTYGLGRGIEPSDAPAIRKVVRQAKEEDYAFSAVITGIAKCVPFTMRTSENPE